MMDYDEIEGHPALEAINGDGKKINITVCSDCGSLSTILFLVGDRWYCTKCKSSGNAAPTVVPLRRP
jgi:ribosomal protein S27AE